MTIYSRTKDDADDDLTFMLRRSIDLIEREKAMAKKNGKKKSERASVSRERRIALALRAVLDAAEDNNISEELTTACREAEGLLDFMGYSGMIGIPSRLKELNKQLAVAVDAGDGKEISRLGLAIEKAKAGKDVQQPKAVAAEA